MSPELRAVPLFVAVLLIGILGGCSGSGAGQVGGAEPLSGLQLVALEQGRLVDVYGYRIVNGNKVVTLFQRDVLTGLDITDERVTSGSKRDEEIRYDFLNANPDNLQPRLLIPRAIGGEEFRAAFAALDDEVRKVLPGQYGRSSQQTAYSVVPRNAALRLRFSGVLPIDDGFFYELDDLGRVVGFKNTVALQLLEIVGDPNDGQHVDDFEEIAARISVRGDSIILDPVLLGSEGLTYGVRNSAAGMPEAPDQVGANMRVAIALEGPLRIPGLKADDQGSLSGRNNGGAVAVIRDFRSGNQADNSAEIARGFLRDNVPPRIIGEMRMYLERVEQIDAETRLLSIYKGPIAHELDRSDILRLLPDNSGVPAAVVEILEDPSEDRGRPEVDRVRVKVRAVFGAAGEDLLEAIDPSQRSDFPEPGPKRDAYLVSRAPRAVLVAEYTHRRAHPDPNSPVPYYGDDPRNFLTFNPQPLPDPGSGVVIANERVSSFAGAVLRFSKPVDMETLIALDTVFFATRNLLDRDAIDAFITSRNIDPGAFSEAKFRTPHLLHSRIFDEDGSQTAVRVQPTLGFYLDEAMRDAFAADQHKPFAERRYHYHLHLVGGLKGVRDLAGNPLDFGSAPIQGQPAVESVVMPFSLDAGRDSQKAANQPDNLVVYIVRRFADNDEDELPSYYIDAEVMKPGQNRAAVSLPHDDLFGPVSYLEDGTLVARAGSRVRAVVDSLNQLSAPPQTDVVLRWCPQTVRNQGQIIFQTAAAPFGQPIQNPLNPYGCRLQTVWRDVDMSLSRTDPAEFNLDVEQMYWAPFSGGTIVFDEFDRVSMFLGHSEYRPEPCINTRSAFPSMPNSGLVPTFAENYAHNRDTSGQIEEQPARHPAFVDRQLTISAKDAITERNGVYRYLPLPKFEDATKISGMKNALFVWRDEQVYVQGGNNRISTAWLAPYPYLLGPFLGGRGQSVIDANGTTYYQPGRWYNGTGRRMNGAGTDTRTGGQVGAPGLPLMADFWVYPDSAGLPTYDPFLASGANGWQVSIAVGSTFTPSFRNYSGGRSTFGGKEPLPVDPTHPSWARGSGGWDLEGNPTRAGDNTVYWVMADLLKRTAVVTSGFIEIANPHRIATLDDPRLGPYETKGRLPSYAYDFEPSLASLPPGTKVVPEFRGASALAPPSTVWPNASVSAVANGSPQAYQNPVTPRNFPNDPRKAGDAHIRKYDNRLVPNTGKLRNHWVYMYNNQITRYTEDPNDLSDETYVARFSGPNESFRPADVKYFNWRFIMQNNVEANPPLAPSLQSFSVSYRLQTGR